MASLLILGSRQLRSERQFSRALPSGDLLLARCSFFIVRLTNTPGGEGGGGDQRPMLQPPGLSCHHSESLAGKMDRAWALEPGPQQPQGLGRGIMEPGTGLRQAGRWPSDPALEETLNSASVFPAPTGDTQYPLQLSG